MPYKEKEIQKIYYTIGEVASMFNVNTSHIRFWSKQFAEIKPATNKKGNRLFTQSDIENIKKIYHLVKEQGFTLKGAKVQLKADRQNMKLKGEPISSPEMSNTTAMSDVVIVEVPTFSQPQLADAASDDFVDKIALINSLNKIRSSVMEVQKELALLED